MTRFLQFLSKTDNNAIKHSSHFTNMSQSAYGIMVLLTGILAFLSGSYAIFISLNSSSAAIGIGFLYSLIIMTIDREIVSAANKRAALVRLPLAILIGFIVAIPIELRLFQARIEQELQRGSNEENKEAYDRYKKAEEVYFDKERQLQLDILKYQDNVVQWGSNMEAEVVGRIKPGRTGIAGEGSAYRAAKEQLELNAKLLSDTKARLEKVEAEKKETLARFKQVYDKEFIAPAYDLLARYEGLKSVTANSSSAYWISWGIWCLIVFIEMFPALMKLASPYNEYNAIIEAGRREDIRRVRAIANEHLDQIEENPLGDSVRLLDTLGSGRRSESQTNSTT